MGFFQKMAYRFRMFMNGRCGVDQLGFALMTAGIILSAVLSLTVGFPWYYLSYIIYIYAFFRIFSRNLTARRRENDRFMRVWNGIAGWFRVRRAAFRDRKTYKYFRCPGCGLHLRAPRGKGKIRITCQRCRKIFEKKT